MYETKMKFVLLNVLLTLYVCINSTVKSDTTPFSVNNLYQRLSEDLANSSFSTEDVKILIRNKCEEVLGLESGAQAFQEFESGMVALGECVNKLVNYTVIQEEISEASPRGELDVVFNKYCNKRPAALECVEDFNSKLFSCLLNEERDSQLMVMRIIKSLLNFVCHKGGDQIALFIAEKGPECLDSKKDDIRDCVNKTFFNYLPREKMDKIKLIPNLVLGEKQCHELDILENCIVERLEKCVEITPANIVESMFKFIKNETMCRYNSPVSTDFTANGSINIKQIALVSVFLYSILGSCFTEYYLS